jgi:hypothetical protein
MKQHIKDTGALPETLEQQRQAELEKERKETLALTMDMMRQVT